MSGHNTVLEKVLGHHKKQHQTSFRHVGNHNYPITMLGATSKPIRTISGASISGGNQSPNIRIEEMLGDYL